MIEIAERTVSVERSGAMLVATVDHPPVNALSRPVRAGLIDAVDRFEADADAGALVIICAGRTFMAGADLRELDGPPREPRLGELIDRLDRCAKPVIAAMHGTALGGGLEVALACSYRIALASARLGLPEVRLGLLPGSGGIVRLPRLVGVEHALTMICEGGQIDAAEALALGLLDEVTTGDLRAAAIAFGERIVRAGAPVRPTSALPVPAFDAGLLAAKRTELARKYRGQTAPRLAVDLIEMAATTPFAEAARKEYLACRELLASPQSRALRHLFAAERAVAKIDGVGADVVPRPVRKVAVVGPGTMGRGIAQCLLGIGLPVVLVGRRRESLDEAVAAIERSLAARVGRGSMAPEERDRAIALLRPTLDHADLADVDLVIEAVTEDLDVKKMVCARLEAALGEHAIIATNTSFLDIEALAASLARPANFAGMHFFNPANAMRLVENARAAATAPDVLATLADLARRLGKLPVSVGAGEGFVANRMLAKRTREALFLIEEGATPHEVDRVLVDFGFPLGPFALADLAGLDVVAATRAARLAAMTAREQSCDIADRLVAAGRLGRKTGAGYYRYGEDGKPRPDAAVDEMLAAHRAARGIAQRVIGDQEILERCLLAMINEAARILDEGVAARPGDIDVIWTSGLGWPRHLGGPMFWADETGLVNVLESLRTYSHVVGADHFGPAALIERLVAEGRGFCR